MSTTTNFAAVVSNETKSVATQIVTKSLIEDLVGAGFVREDYLQLNPGFQGWYTVGKVEYIKKNSKKLNKEIDLPKVPLKRNTGSVITWGTTLMNALVLEETIIKTPTIQLEEGRTEMPLWFRDDINKEFSNLEKLGKLKNEDGSFSFHDKYYIVGAILNRSKVDPTRWGVSYNMYEKGSFFLELAKKSDSSLTYLYEDQLIEMSKMSKEKRTFESSIGEMTLPSFKELKVLGNAKVDPRYANAQFIIAKTW